MLMSTLWAGPLKMTLWSPELFGKRIWTLPHSSMIASTKQSLGSIRDLCRFEGTEISTSEILPIFFLNWKNEITSQFTVFWPSLDDNIFWVAICWWKNNVGVACCTDFFYVCTSFSNDIFVKPFEDGNCYGIATFYNVCHHILQILCAFF